MKGCLHPTSLHGAGQQLDSQETASCSGTFDVPQCQTECRGRCGRPVTQPPRRCSVVGNGQGLPCRPLAANREPRSEHGC